MPRLAPPALALLSLCAVPAVAWADVTAYVVHGALRLRGDLEDDLVRIEPATTAGSVLVKSDGPETLVNGLAEVEFAEVASLDADLGLGANALAVLDVDLAGDLVVSSFDVDGGEYTVEGARIDGRCRFLLGSGPDNLTFGTTTIGRSLVVRMDPGAGDADLVQLNQTSVQGSMWIDAGPGDDTVLLDRTGTPPASFGTTLIDLGRTEGGTLTARSNADPIEFRKGLTVRSGGTDDVVSLDDVKVARKLAVDLGAGEDVLLLGVGFEAGGVAAQLGAGSDFVQVSGVSVTGQFTCVGGPDDDVFLADSESTFGVLPRLVRFDAVDGPYFDVSVAIDQRNRLDVHAGTGDYALVVDGVVEAAGIGKMRVNGRNLRFAATDDPWRITAKFNFGDTTASSKAVDSTTSRTLEWTDTNFRTGP